METNILKLLAVADIASIGNVLSGLFAIISIINGDTILAAQFMLLAVICDALDGTLARKFKKDRSPIFGETIDSLADMVSFGVAPAVILYNIIPTVFVFIPMLLLVICGILRLTRYNVIASQQSGPTTVFVGLPIPTSALMLAIIILSGIDNPYLIIIVMTALAILMVSSVDYVKVSNKKIIGVLCILIILCIIPSVNGLLLKIPSYIVLICLFVYIFGTLIMELFFKKYNSKLKLPMTALNNDLHKK